MSPHEALFGQCKLEHGSDYKLLKNLNGLNNSDFKILPKACKMNIIHNRVKESLAKAHKTYEKTYNTSSKTCKFKEGQVVLKRNFILSDKSKKRNAKLCPKFIQAKIKKIVSNNLYELEDLNGKPLGIIHAKDLRT
ncbi:uncharacterized protein LOC129953571 [Eupeodes corollae]|uniref:uncharacterized protein LOC129953571 n=1 Tax=Eupeodes corollae TaxID=290404 RepID=UPI002493A618|nr:uncharacterized protein LOC129953571 [Eupeodes corollae]